MLSVCVSAANDGSASCLADGRKQRCASYPSLGPDHQSFGLVAWKTKKKEEVVAYIMTYGQLVDY